MLKRFFYIAISAIIVIFFVFQSQLLRKQSILLKRSNDIVELKSQQVYDLKQGYFDSWKIGRTSICVDEIYDEDGKLVDSSFFENKNPVLLFRFSIKNCATCDANKIEIFKEIQNIPLECRLICNYHDKSSLNAFKRMNEISGTVYNTVKSSDIEAGKMFLCIYYQGFVSDVFFPDEKIHDLTKSYIHAMSSKYRQ